MDSKIRKYKQEYDYSYTLGMAPTMELIKMKREQIEAIYVHPKFKAREAENDIYRICAENNLPCETNEKIFNRIATKENTYVLGVFRKFSSGVSNSAPHIVLVNPSDSGNLGTIIRTGVGFNFRNIVIIKPSADIYDPKVVRASMGAIFYSNFEYFNSFEEYMDSNKDYEFYSFMLNGSLNLKDIKRPDNKFALVFGNEATGLPDKFLQYGKSVCISHTNDIDSFNLAIAFGIAANAFTDL